jgi:SAM-dependent methyltransferase
MTPAAAEPTLADRPPAPLDLAPLEHAPHTGRVAWPLADPSTTAPAALAARLRRWRLPRLADELGLDELLAPAHPGDAAPARRGSLCLLDGRDAGQLAARLDALARGGQPACVLVDHARTLDADAAPLAAALQRLRASHHHYALKHDAGWWLFYPRSSGVAPDWAQRWLWLLPDDRTVSAAPSLGVPGVTAISMRRRLADSRFATRYFRGQALDVGGGRDSLAVYREFFPLLTDVLVYDMPQGDAQLLDNLPDASFDCVYSSHCLEHLRDPREALGHWLRVLKPGGHLVVNVPDEDLYEQGRWPSRFNSDHKLSFTIYKVKSWSPVSVNLLDLVRDLGDAAECLSLARIDDGYRHQLAGQGLDQTRTPLAEAAIELVLRKPQAAASAAPAGAGQEG